MKKYEALAEITPLSYFQFTPDINVGAIFPDA
jgi:hypothetical protein